MDVNGTQMEIVNINGTAIESGNGNFLGANIDKKIINGNSIYLNDKTASNLTISNSILNTDINIEFYSGKINFVDSIVNNLTFIYPGINQEYDINFKGKTVINSLFKFAPNNTTNNIQKSSLTLDDTVTINDTFYYFDQHNSDSTNSSNWGNLKIVNNGGNLKIFHEFTSGKDIDLSGTATIYESANVSTYNKKINIQNGGKLIVRADMNTNVVTGLKDSNSTIVSTGGDLFIY